MDHYRARLLASLLFLILTATAIVLRRPVLHPPPAPLHHSAAPYLSQPPTSGPAPPIETKQPPVRTETSQAKQAAAGAPEGAAQPAAEARASEPQNAFQTANTKPVEQVTPAFPERMAGTTIYTVRAGESVESIASHFLSQTSFMTSGELVSAIRVANPDLAKALHAGQQLVIPGVEAAIVERPVRVPRGLEV